MIRWCENCIYPTKNKICKLCGSRTTLLTENVIPVFFEEKLLISYIINKDITLSQVWNLGKNNYLIDGKKIKVDFNKIMNNEKVLGEISYKVNNTLVEKNNFIEFTNFKKGNADYLNELIIEVHNYINNIVKSYPRHQLIVSWSGGKDSTVVSDLVKNALGNQKILHIFGDTRMEFPTTYEYYDKFKTKNVFTPFIVAKSDKDFFELCDIFGPPSRVMRWCCSIFKTGPISANFNEIISKDILTFYGIRRVESTARSRYLRTEKSPKISRQTVSAPIIDWDDFDVWLYIISRNLEFNKAYRYGFRRVGCLYCPNNSRWSEFLSSIFFREKYEMWKEYLYNFAQKIGKKDYVEYINNGNWKARQGGYGLDTFNTEVKSIDCNLHENAQNYIFDKPITDNLIQYLKPLGKMKVIENDGGYKLIISHIQPEDIIVYWDKSSVIVKVIINTDKNVSLIKQRLECQLRKYKICILCSACDSVCPVGAISTKGKYTISEKCIHCGKCIAHFRGGCLINKTLYKANKSKI